MKFLVTYSHPSVFYKSRHYGRNANRNLGIKVFDSESEAQAFVREASAHGATNVKVRIHG